MFIRMYCASIDTDPVTGRGRATLRAVEPGDGESRTGLGPDGKKAVLKGLSETDQPFIDASSPDVVMTVLFPGPAPIEQDQAFTLEFVPIPRK